MCALLFHWALILSTYIMLAESRNRGGKRDFAVNKMIPTHSRQNLWQDSERSSVFLQTLWIQK